MDLLRENAKAIVGLILPLILVWLSKAGLDLDETALETLLVSLIVAIPTAIGVWWKKNTSRVLEVKQVVDVSPPVDQ